MNPVILADNRFLEGTPTATDTATGYDVLHIRDLRTFTSWKGATAGTKYLADLPRATKPLIVEEEISNKGPTT